MDNLDPAQHLVDAVDLIAMLECLTDSLSREDTAHVPWAGISLTLRQTREKVIQAHNTLSGNYFDAPQPPSRQIDSFKGAALSERLQQIPVSGSRARDLVAGGAPAATAAPVATAKGARSAVSGGRMGVNDLPDSELLR